MEVSTRSLASRTQLPSFDGNRNEKPPTVGMVTIQCGVNFAQLSRQTHRRVGVYEQNVPSLKTTAEDLSLYAGQMAFSVKDSTPGIGGAPTGHPLVQTSLNNFDGLQHDDVGMTAYYNELLRLFPHEDELAQALLVCAIASRIRIEGYVMEETRFTDERNMPRNSYNTTSIVVRGLIGVTNFNNRPMEAGQSVVFRPMTLEQAGRLGTVAAFHTGSSRVRPFTVGVVATTEDYKSLAERQQHHLRLYLQNTRLYMKLFDVTRNQVGRCEMYACEQIVRGQLMQAVLAAGTLMDSGILHLNRIHGQNAVQAQLAGDPYTMQAPANANTDALIEARTDCSDMLMFTRQICAPFFTDGQRNLLWQTSRTPAVGETPRGAIGAYKSHPFMIQLAELLFLIRPSEADEANNQFAGVTKRFLQNSDNKQAALTLRDTIIARMNLFSSNSHIQGLAHEPGAYRLTAGRHSTIDNRNYGASSSSGIRAPDVSKAGGRLLQQAQLASRAIALGHAQIFAADGPHGVVTQPAAVHGMAHVFLGGGNGRMV